MVIDSEHLKSFCGHYIQNTSSHFVVTDSEHLKSFCGHYIQNTSSHFVVIDSEHLKSSPEVPGAAERLPAGSHSGADVAE